MRVISGDFKGRRLISLNGDSTRPTTDKVKESIFNRIGPYFDNEKVLDLFSGSGSLAIEAISRGCSKAVCIDNNFKAVKIIKENVELVKATDKIDVKKMSAEMAINQSSEKKELFDLVFLDPPYRLDVIPRLIELMEEQKIVSSNCIIICETDNSKELPQQIVSFFCYNSQNYGNTKVSLYRREE